MSRNRQPNPNRLVGKVYGDLTVIAVALATLGAKRCTDADCV
jgi:hypothetical protein